MVTSKLFSIVSYIQSINLLWAFLCLTDLSTFISCIILRSFMNIKPYVHRRKFLKAPRGSWKKGNCNLIFLGMRKIKVLRDVSLLAASDGSKKKVYFMRMMDVLQFWPQRMNIYLRLPLFFSFPVDDKLIFMMAEKEP